ncbi:MAG: menaquinone biosynthesis protein [Deltaproteobacteria bacterium]|nr:MAG: menaquinone biosynthesis protein [Deltaproteobacteria bacterium]
MLYHLGAVPYWNSLPLIHYLPLDEKPRLEVPAALARLLKIGEIDIATAPIVTLFENPHYTLIPGVCIGSRGAVKSVKLFFTSPEVTVHNVKTIYLDMESKTSALLLKVLLKFKYGRDLNDIQFFHPLPPRHVEGKLLIGDKAMLELPTNPALDLGEEWTSWTGLPFVFAAWMSRHPEVSDKAIQELQQARDQGVKNIASVIPHKTSLPFEVIKSYLENLNYFLGTEETKAIALFKDYIFKAELLKS